MKIAQVGYHVEGLDYDLQIAGRRWNDAFLADALDGFDGEGGALCDELLARTAWSAVHMASDSGALWLWTPRREGS